ncbi:MAG: hypothetical protein ACTSX8_09095 [Alphaproteobacteria bacterium]
MARRKGNSRWAVDNLSDKGRALVRRMIIEGTTYSAACRQLKIVTGEKLSVTSLSRWWKREEKRAAEQQAAVARIQQREMLLESIKNSPGIELTKKLTAALEDQVLQRVAVIASETEEVSTLELMKHLRAQQALNLKEKGLVIAQQEADAETKRADAQMIQAKASEKRADVLERKLIGVKGALEGAEKDAKARGDQISAKALSVVRQSFYGLDDMDDADNVIGTGHAQA